MRVHINYAHHRFLKSQQHCCRTAKEVGGFDESHPLGIGDLDPDFIRDNSSTLSQRRGAGYWIWKPHLILGTMRRLNEDDWLMYTDAGMYFRKSPWPLIESLADRIGDKGIITFGAWGMERQYTKRDAFVLTGMDRPRFTDTAQRHASIFACRRTPFSVAFVEAWIRYVCDPRIVTDLPNTQGLPNYPEFKDHRHDQSVMSLLSKRHDTCYSKDITQWGSPEDPCVIHTRNPQ